MGDVFAAGQYTPRLVTAVEITEYKIDFVLPIPLAARPRPDRPMCERSIFVPTYVLLVKSCAPFSGYIATGAFKANTYSTATK